MLTTAQKIESALAARELQEKLAALKADYAAKTNAAWETCFNRLKAAGIGLVQQDGSPIQS